MPRRKTTNSYKFDGHYSQGSFKFALYEIFKYAYSNMAGEENAKKYKGLIWCAGAASAEGKCLDEVLIYMCVVFIQISFCFDSNVSN